MVVRFHDSDRALKAELPPSRFYGGAVQTRSFSEQALEHRCDEAAPLCLLTK